MSKSYRAEPGVKQKAAEKVSRIPVKITPLDKPLRKPDWIRAKAPAHPEVKRLKKVLRENKLFTVCEEASCPNLGECFGHGTATFMIMGGNLYAALSFLRCGPWSSIATGYGRTTKHGKNHPGHGT